MKERDAPVGTPNEVVQKLGEYSEAGIEGVMLQLIDMDDITMLETFAAEVLPQLK
jgi:alkanesulfonate monooxygenase SsuD/methylene tetrahydromethanopterin reductase-like flavin-dependent oxidoreductase (luciferase family)